MRRRVRHRGAFCISPLGTTWVALRRQEGWRLPGFAPVGGGDAKPARDDACTAVVSAAFSELLAGLAAAGALLFLAAHRRVLGARLSRSAHACGAACSALIS